MTPEQEALRRAFLAEDVDEIAVERACRGDRAVRLNRSEVAAAFAYLNAHGYSARAIGERLGVTPRTVARWRSGVTARPFPWTGRKPGYRRLRIVETAALKPSPAEPEQPGELAS